MPSFPNFPGDQAASQSTSFLLTGAVPSPPVADALLNRVPSPVGTSGSFDRAIGGEPKSYVLEGNDIELANHAGQRVEITGTLLPPSGPSSQITPIVPPDMIQGRMDGMPRLRVTSVRVLASSCVTNG